MNDFVTIAFTVVNKSYFGFSIQHVYIHMYFIILNSNHFNDLL